jgi:hypothetical protein
VPIGRPDGAVGRSTFPSGIDPFVSGWTYGLGSRRLPDEGTFSPYHDWRLHDATACGAVIARDPRTLLLTR